MAPCGERRRLHPAEERRHLAVELGQRQEALHVEADHERAVGEDARGRPGGAGAGEDAAQDLDRERETVALVLARGEQRAGRSAVEDLGIGLRPALRVHEPAGRGGLLAVALHAQLALGHHAGGEVEHHRGAARAGDADRVRVRAEAPRGAAPRRHVEPVHAVGPEQADEPGIGGHLRVVGEPAHVAGARGGRGAQAARLRLRDRHLHRAPAHHLAEAAAAVEPHQRGVSAVTVIGDLGSTSFFLTDSSTGDADHAVRIVAAQVRAYEQRGDPRRVAVGRAHRGEDAGGLRFEPGGVDGRHVGYNTPAMTATKAEHEFFDPAPLPWRPAPGFPAGVWEQVISGGVDEGVTTRCSASTRLGQRPRRDPRLLGGDLHHLGHARVRRPPLPGGLGRGAARPACRTDRFTPAEAA